MSRWRIAIARLLEWLHRGRADADLRDELASHVDHLTDEYIRRGRTPAEARRAALLDFGGIEPAREAVRDRRGLRPLDTLARDVRYAIRLLARAPGFSAAVLLTLALGIGANAAIFSLVDGVLLRPLPYHAPDRLVAIWEQLPPPAVPGAAEAGPARIAVAPANLRDYRRARQAAAIAGYSRTTRNVGGAGEPERLQGEMVTPEYFAVLGVPPLHGRTLQAGDVAAGRALVVISHPLWRDRFGGRADALGATLTLDDARFEIVGVMPATFKGVSELRDSTPAAFWIPATFTPDVLENRNEHLLSAIARLAPGASAGGLADELRGMAASFATTGGPALSVGVAALDADIAGDARPLLLLLLAAVGLVLLLACVNVASLLVVRSISRRREIAVRLALGATRGRVARELLAQSIVLAIAGAAAGLGVAVLLHGWLLALTPATIPRLDAVSIDGRVLLFTLAITAITAVAFTVVPALQLGRAPSGAALATTGRVVAGTFASRARTGLLIAEIAFSTLLLAGAALMMRSLATLNAVPLGFDPSGVITAQVRLPASRYPTPDARLQFFEEVEQRLGAMPGAEAVAFANRLPLRGGWTSGLVIESPEGVVPAELGHSAGFQSVSPGYFDVIRLPLVRGRLLTAADREGRPGVAVVNEAFVQRFFGAADAIGRRLRRFPTGPSIEIVGVVADSRRGGRLRAIEPEVYLPAAQTSLYPLPLEQVAVRVPSDAAARASDLRAAVWAVDAGQPVAAVRTLDDALRLQQGERRFQTFLFSMFAALALVLAVVGTYGVVAYAVSQRTAEIALRMALGATAGGILRWTLGGWLRVVAAGVVLGIAGALALGDVVRSLLFEISPADPLALGGAVAVLALAALAACLAAARAATKVEAASVLK